MKYFIVSALLLIFSMKAHAQIDQGQQLDKVVAVVGGEIVLQSDVQTRLGMMIQQNPKLDYRDKELNNRILDALINEKLVITKAIEDSVTATEDEITERLDFQIQSLTQQVGSERRVEEIYGMPIARIKREFRDEIRKQLLSEKLEQQKFGSVKASQKEVEEFYVKFKDSLPTLPAAVELFHIVKNVEAAKSAKEETRKTAKAIRDSIIAGGDFADFAKRYSKDPGSASSGGDLGFVDKGKFIAEYELAAYQLQINQISDPVETPFGFHIIQLLEKRTDAVHTRHILLKVGQTIEDADKVKNFLDSLKKLVEIGGNFEELAKKSSDDEDSRAFGGLIGTLEVSKLPEDARKAIEAMKDGDVSAPLPYTGNPLKTAQHILFRKKFIPAHTPSLQTDFKKIEQLAGMFKKNKAYDEWIQELRKTMYWEIKD